MSAQDFPQRRPHAVFTTTPSSMLTEDGEVSSIDSVRINTPESSKVEPQQASAPIAIKGPTHGRVDSIFRLPQRSVSPISAHRVPLDCEPFPDFEAGRVRRPEVRRMVGVGSAPAKLERDCPWPFQVSRATQKFLAWDFSFKTMHTERILELQRRPSYSRVIKWRRMSGDDRPDLYSTSSAPIVYPVPFESGQETWIEQARDHFAHAPAHDYLNEESGDQEDCSDAKEDHNDPNDQPDDPPNDKKEEDLDEESYYDCRPSSPIQHRQFPTTSARFYDLMGHGPLYDEENDRIVENYHRARYFDPKPRFYSNRRQAPTRHYPDHASDDEAADELSPLLGPLPRHLSPPLDLAAETGRYIRQAREGGSPPPCLLSCFPDPRWTPRERHREHTPSPFMRGMVFAVTWLPLLTSLLLAVVFVVCMVYETVKV